MAHRVLWLHARYGIGGDVVDGYVGRPALPWMAAAGASGADAEE